MQGLDLLRPRQRGCKFAQVLEDARSDEEAVAQAVEQAIDDGIPATRIAEFLTVNGHRLGRSAVSTHMNRTCCCDR